jgi:hypothetical protein
MGRDAKSTAKEIQAALVGFPRQLRWSDFGPWNDEHADAIGHDATIATNVKVTSWALALGGKFGSYIDNLKVTVTLDSARTYATEAARTKAALLNHEQGHFDIQGLLARDLAIKLLDFHIDKKVLADILNNRAASWEDKVKRLDRIVRDHMRQVQQRFKELDGMLQDDALGNEGIYDADTEHGADAAEQRRWDSLLRHVKMSTVLFEDELIKRGMLNAAGRTGGD